MSLNINFKDYKRIVIDGRDLFDYLWKSVQKNQFKVYKSEKIYSIRLANHYILLFDSLIRILIKFRMFQIKLIKKFKNKNIYIHTRKLRYSFTPKFDILFSKKRLEFNDFRNELIQVIVDLKSFQFKYNPQIINMVNWCYKRFKIDETKLDIFTPISDFNHAIVHFIYLITLHQTSIDFLEMNWLYTILCEFSKFKLISDINNEIVYNSIYLTNRKDIKSFNYCYISDFQFNQREINKNWKINPELIPSEKYNEVLPDENRNIEEISKLTMGTVISINDLNLLNIFKKPYEIFKYNKNLNQIKISEKPKSLTKSNYLLFRSEFKNVIQKIFPGFTEILFKYI